MASLFRNKDEKEMNKAQRTVLTATILAIEETGREYVGQAAIAQHMSKLPHPNTLDALVREGVLVTDPSVSWSQYKVA